jgi:pyruvate formate-lyase activating enzyme-like uncharacterized protein
MGTAQAELKPLDGIDLVARYEAMAKELAEAKAEAQLMAERNRELLHRNVELRKQLDAGNVLSKESFDECVGDAAVVVDEYELGKLVKEAVKDERQRLRDGECIYVAIDLPRSFKTTGDEEFPDLTAMRCDSPDRNGVAYEIHVG